MADPPVCADPRTGRRLHCDDVESCFDSTAWAPHVGNDIAKKLGVSKVLLCTPRP
jgi:hypothetical protein